MARRAVVATVAAAALLIAATIAYACTPQAYMTLDKTTTYQPGVPVTVAGHLFDPKAATPVTLRWGADGPVIGQAPIASDGSWMLSFQIPDETTPGTYVLYAVASDAGGHVIDGLPARVALPVEAPPDALPTHPVVTPAVSAPAVGAAPKPKARVAPVPPAPVSSAVAPLAASQVTTASGPSRTNVVAFQPAPRLAPAPLPALAQPGAAPALPVAVARPERSGIAWYALALGALGLLGLGAAAGGLVIARRFPPSGPSDVLEAELQEIIAEERARQAELVD